MYQFGWTPLHYAAHFNAVSVPALLIEKGANVNATAKVNTNFCLYSAI